LRTAKGYNIIGAMAPETQLQLQEATWVLLMRAAQGGDAARYEQLLRSVTPFIRNLVRRYCRDPQLAEDVVQDTLLTVHRIRHTWDPQRPFSPWLASIAARRGIDRIRRATRVARHEVSDDLALETFSAPAANNESGALRAAETIAPLLAALPERQRRALEAVKIRGLSMAEAASESGQSVAALKVTVHRAVKALRSRVPADRDGERDSDN
jgi:RNA polymerase sigma-70 factor (ECF subfamily)